MATSLRAQPHRQQGVLAEQLLEPGPHLAGGRVGGQDARAVAWWVVVAVAAADGRAPRSPAEVQPTAATTTTMARPVRPARTRTMPLPVNPACSG